MELIFDESFFEGIQLIKEEDKMAGLNINWDGSDIGAIDNHIYQCQKLEDDHILTLIILNSKGVVKFVHAKILRYKNEIPFIIDECKPLFGLQKIGKHKATLKDIKVVLVRFQGDVSLKKYFKDTGLNPMKTGTYFIEELRKIFAFRYLMCLNCNYENTIEVRTGTGINHPITCRENTFNYDSMSLSTRIPKTIIKNWFNNDDTLLDKIITEMVKDKDASMFRFKIQEIIMRFDKHLISWNNGIFDKILIAQK